MKHDRLSLWHAQRGQATLTVVLAYAIFAALLKWLPATASRSAGLLDKGDIAAQSYFEQHAAEFQAMLDRQTVSALQQALSGFRFESAAQLLRDWKPAPGGK